MNHKRTLETLKYAFKKIKVESSYRSATSLPIFGTKKHSRFSQLRYQCLLMDSKLRFLKKEYIASEELDLIQFSIGVTICISLRYLAFEICNPCLR